MRQDILHALRLFRHNPGFAAIVIGIVALGVGANTAMFSAIDAVVLKPLPFAEPERLAILWETRPDRGIANNVVSAANYFDWRARNKSFDAMSAFQFPFFPLLGVRMALGRTFSTEENQPGAAATAAAALRCRSRDSGKDDSPQQRGCHCDGSSAGRHTHHQ